MNEVEIVSKFPDFEMVHLWNILQTVRKSRNIAGMNMSPIFLMFGAKNIVKHYGKRIEILHWFPFESWPKRARPFHPFGQKLAYCLNCLYPVESALKRTPVHNFNCFSIMFYYITRGWVSKFATHKSPFYHPFWPFFRHCHNYLSQNWDSDGHFEMLNRSLP